MTSPPLTLFVIGSGPAGVHASRRTSRRGPDPVRGVTADVDAPYQRPPPSKAVLVGGEPPEVTPILDDEVAPGDVELLHINEHVAIRAAHGRSHECSTRSQPRVR